jgi:alpha,alpha-trehalase
LFQYDATVPGGHGGGGEYETQVGFGWTNGVIMELLDKYGDRLTARDRFTEPESKPNYQSDSRINIAAAAPLPSVGQVLTGILALVVTLAAGCIG